MKGSLVDFLKKMLCRLDCVCVCVCVCVLVVTAQTYGLRQLLQKCIDFVRCKSFTELQKDPYFKRLESGNLIHILQLRVLDLESSIDQVRQLSVHGFITEIKSLGWFFLNSVFFSPSLTSHIQLTVRVQLVQFFIIV